MSPHHQTARRVGPRRLAAAVVGALAAAALLTACLSADQTSTYDLVNATRRTNSKAALDVDYSASSKAQKWSQHMAATGVLEHTGGGTTVDPTGITKWCTITENVGKGPSIQAIHDGFLASPQHKANMLGNVDRIGVGVYKQGNTYWVTEIFIRTC